MKNESLYMREFSPTFRYEWHKNKFILNHNIYYGSLSHMHPQRGANPRPELH